VKGSIARGTVRTTFVLGLRLLVQAGTLLLVARMLGPHEFGAFAGIAALATILGTLSTVGTHLVLLGEVSKEPGRRNQVLPYAVPTTLLCGSGLFAVYLVVCMLVLGEAGVSLQVLFAIGITETLLQPLFALMAFEHHALGRIARSQLLQLLPLALRLATAAAVFALRLPHPLEAYAIGYLAASFVALAFGTTKLPAPWPHPIQWRLPGRKDLAAAVGYAAINITRTGPAELDKTLAVKLLPLGAAGIYAASSRVIAASTLPVVAMLLAALPRLFRHASDQPQRIQSLLRHLFSASLLYGLVLAGALWILAPLFDWVFGPKYNGIDEFVRWLCLAVPGMTLRMAAGSALMALGRPWVRVAFEASGLLVLILTAPLLANSFSGIGLCLALICSEWAMALVGGWFTYRQYRSQRLRATYPS
jgi:O-antigen/teichoic acid export membrane protein